MPSLIERMVDAACGVPSGHPEVNGHDADDAWLILFCPQCGRFMAVERFPEIDPPKATFMELQCDRCNHGDFDSPGYWDGAGRELGPEDWPEAIR